MDEMKYFDLNDVLENDLFMEWELVDCQRFTIDALEPAGALDGDGIYQMVYKVKDEATKHLLLSAWPRCEWMRKSEFAGG